MKKNLNELMSALGCEKCPERWNKFFDEVKADVEINGCKYATAEYYDEIGNKYDILNRYRDSYKSAAIEIGKNPDLTLFLALLCHSLADRENYKEDLKQLSMPKAPEGTNTLPYDMLTGLANCSLVDYSYNKLKGMGIDNEMIKTSLRLPENGVWEYMKRNDGRPGYHLLDWFQLAIEGKLFLINRLEMELFSKFSANAVVLRNASGETIALADGMTLHECGIALGSAHYEDEKGSFEATMSETDTSYVGNPIDDITGYVKKKTVELKKSEWTPVLRKGDTVVGVHIPPNGSLKDEDVEATIAQTREFIARYFPDVDYKAFCCGSWLMDSQLFDMVGHESNIAKFGKRFKKITRKCSGRGVFYFVFLKRNGDTSYKIEDLPENTRLEKAIKSFYLNDKAVYEIYGYFF
jgi:hypothetical protein